MPHERERRAERQGWAGAERTGESRSVARASERKLANHEGSPALIARIIRPCSSSWLTVFLNFEVANLARFQTAVGRVDVVQQDPRPVEVRQHDPTVRRSRDNRPERQLRRARPVPTFPVSLPASQENRPQRGVTPSLDRVDRTDNRNCDHQRRKDVRNPRPCSFVSHCPDRQRDREDNRAADEHAPRDPKGHHTAATEGRIRALLHLHRLHDPEATSGSSGVPLSEKQLSPLDDFWVVPVHRRPVARNDLRPTAIASDEVDPVLVARRHVDDDLGTVTSDGR